MNPMLVLVLVVATASGVLAGCIYPSRQTYYEVASVDGQRGPSTCTYPDERQDAIERELGPARLSASSSVHDTESLWIVVGVSTATPDARLDATQIGLSTAPNLPPAKPASVKSSSHSTGNANDARPVRHWLHLRYPVRPDRLGDFTLLFGPSALVVDGRQVPVAPIRFRKVTKTGIYLFTINC